VGQDLSPIRQTCISIIRYEKEFLEIISDYSPQKGQSKILFRRYLLMKAKSLLHEFELMQHSDPTYVRDIVKHSSTFKKINNFIELFSNESSDAL